MASIQDENTATVNALESSLTTLSVASIQKDSRTPVHALEYPEILDLVARELPIFRWVDTDNGLEGFLVFEPEIMLGCICVSRLWHQVFMPHLWHYYFNHDMDPVSNTTMDRDVFLKNFSLVRRHMHARAPEDQDLIFTSKDEEDKEKEEDTEVEGEESTAAQQRVRVPMPRNLLGLFIYMKPTETMARLLAANAHHLRELHLQGGVRIPMHDLPEDPLLAMKSMPYLQELCLAEWNVPTQDLAQILAGCQETLQSLRLLSVSGFDISPKPSAMSSLSSLLPGGYHPHRPLQDDPWAGVCLSQVKELGLRLDWTESRAAVFLPRLCPNLESIKLEVDREPDMEGLIQTLRLFCPKLKALQYKEGYSMMHDFGYFPEPEVYRSLIEDCARPLEDEEADQEQGDQQQDHPLDTGMMVALRNGPIDLTREGAGRTTSTLCTLIITLENGFDDASFTDSILVHAATLEHLTVHLRHRGSASQCMHQIQRIMQSCPRLKTAKFVDLPQLWTWEEARTLFLNPSTTHLSDSMDPHHAAMVADETAVTRDWVCKGLQTFVLQEDSVDEGELIGVSDAERAPWQQFEELIEPWKLSEDYKPRDAEARHKFFLFIMSQSESLRMVTLGRIILVR